MDLAETLLQWYDAERRHLPWRATRDPYRIWVSEIMLQQTRVQTVIPYYESFLARFPSVEDLAAAPLDEVLALWSGLGYYRRARQLYQAAQRVAAAGGFPATSRDLQALPGIGPYTAAAVASMAFGESVPVLDGNVERILCRRLGFDGDPKRSAGRQRLLAAAARLLDPRRPGDSNQALMEVGATICRPQGPDCPACPLRQDCRARLAGDPERYPLPRRRRAVEKVEWVIAVARYRGRVLLFRRPEESRLMAGMWELPTVPQQPRLAAIEESLAGVYGGSWRLEAVRHRVRHAITHRALTLHVHLARFEAGDEVGEGPEAAWVGPADRPAFPVSSMVEKVMSALLPPQDLEPEARDPGPTPPT